MECTPAVLAFIDFTGKVVDEEAQKDER